MEKRTKIRLNSGEKVEELLQEIYDQACRHLTEIQNSKNALMSSTNLADENFTMDDKAKYFKAITDLDKNKNNAMQMKLEVAKFLGEMIKHNGDMNATVNDKNFAKRTSLKLSDIKAAINDGTDDSTTYILK